MLAAMNSVCPLCFMCLIISRLVVADCVPIQLTQTVNSKDHAELLATVNSTGLQLASVGFQKYANNTFKYVCVIDVTKGCIDDTSKDCHCKKTSNQFIYNFVFHFNLSTTDNYELVRAAMLNFNDQHIFSNNLTLLSAHNIKQDSSGLNYIKYIWILLPATIIGNGLAVFFALRRCKQRNQGFRVYCGKNASSDCGSEELITKSEKIDLLLIDFTKTGKSLTGNTIIGKKSFKTTKVSDNDENSIMKDSTKYLGVNITVVDGISIKENNLEKDLLLKKLRRSFELEPDGFSALLLIFQYGAQRTGQDVQGINFLKSIFGDDFIEKYCILVIAGGDKFNLSYARGCSIVDWCLNQKGCLRDLCIECNERVVLFDNKTKRLKKMHKLKYYLNLLSSNGELRLTQDKMLKVKLH